MFLEQRIESLERAAYMQISINRSILFSHCSRGPIFSLKLNLDIHKEGRHKQAWQCQHELTKQHSKQVESFAFDVTHIFAQKEDIKPEKAGLSSE